jgi:hypothetical protein
MGMRFSAGQFTVDGAITGLGLADLLLGNVTQLTQGATSFMYARTRYLGIYAQDSCNVFYTREMGGFCKRPRFTSWDAVSSLNSRAFKTMTTLTCSDRGVRKP